MPARLLLERVVKRHVARDRFFELVIDRLTVGSGEVLAVVGPSGCGKSTLLDMCGLAAAPSEAGRLELIDQGGACSDLAALWRSGEHERLAALRAARFGYVLQTGGLLPFLDVRANLELPQRLSGRLDPAHLQHLVDALGLNGLERALPARLSVGERQRVAVARALTHRPDLILADEPTAALDPDNARRVVRLLVALTRESGAGLMLVSHDHALLAEEGLPRVAIRAESGGAGAWRSRLDASGHEARAAAASLEPVP